MSTIADTPSTAAALVEIARLRSLGFDLVEPEEPAELARLQRGQEIISITWCEVRHG